MCVQHVVYYVSMRLSARLSVELSPMGKVNRVVAEPLPWMIILLTMIQYASLGNGNVRTYVAVGRGLRYFDSRVVGIGKTLYSA